MPSYPDIKDTIKSTVPFQYSENFRILSTEFENGQETRRLIDGYPRRNIRISYGPVKYEQGHTIRRFYEEMKGAYTAFNFFFPQGETYVKELASVAAAGGSSVVVRLPSRGAQTYTLYRNNSPQSSGWSFTPSPSIDIPDKATINTVSIGDVFTWSFTGDLVIWARFASRPLVFSDTKRMYSYIQVELKGLYPQEV